MSSAHDRAERFPLGSRLTLAELSGALHPVLHRLRASEPVSWVPALGGWLVTSRAGVAAALRDAERLTVDDPRFSTARVLGPSMLSRDGAEHSRHRAPFVGPFRPRATRARFAAGVAADARELISPIAARGGGELRRELAAPLAARTMMRALGLEAIGAEALLAAYTEISAAVSALSAGAELPASGAAASARLREAIVGALGRDGSSVLRLAATAGTLEPQELASDAAVLLFGGIDTTEGMLLNAVHALLREPDALAAVREREPLLPAAIEESLRLEPAAALLDRYATRELEIAGTRIAAGDLVGLSLAAANRDPSAFAEPDRLRLDRDRRIGHLAFAAGPHVCIGVHLARLEVRTAIAELLARLPGLALAAPAAAEGLVFRRPAALEVRG